MVICKSSERGFGSKGYCRKANSNDPMYDIRYTFSAFTTTMATDDCRVKIGIVFDKSSTQLLIHRHYAWLNESYRQLRELKGYDGLEGTAPSLSLLKLKQEKQGTGRQRDIDNLAGPDQALQSDLITRQVLVLLEQAKGQAIDLRELQATLLPATRGRVHNRWFNRLIRTMYDDELLRIVKIRVKGVTDTAKLEEADVEMEDRPIDPDNEGDGGWEDEKRIKHAWKNASRCALLLPAGLAWIKKDRERRRDETRVMPFKEYDDLEDPSSGLGNRLDVTRLG